MLRLGVWVAIVGCRKHFCTSFFYFLLLLFLFLSVGIGELVHVHWGTVTRVAILITFLGL